MEADDNPAGGGVACVAATLIIAILAILHRVFVSRSAPTRLSRVAQDLLSRCSEKSMANRPIENHFQPIGSEKTNISS